MGKIKLKSNFIDTNLGFGFLYSQYLINKRTGEKVFDPIEMYWWFVRLLDEMEMKGYRPSTYETRDRLVVEITKRYKDGFFKKKGGVSRYEKDIDEDEKALVLKLFKEFSDENGWFDADLVEVHVREEWPDIVGKFVVLARVARRGLFRDPQVQYFYEEFKRFYPDYYTTMLRMGIDEKEVHNPMTTKDSKYRKAYQKVEERTDMEVKSQFVQKAVAGDLQAVNTYMRVREKEKMIEIPDETKDWRGEVFNEKKPRKKKEEEIPIEKPMDNPNWTHEGLEKDVETEKEKKEEIEKLAGKDEV